MRLNYSLSFITSTGCVSIYLHVCDEALSKNDWKTTKRGDEAKKKKKGEYFSLVHEEIEICMRNYTDIKHI